MATQKVEVNIGAPGSLSSSGWVGECRDAPCVPQVTHGLPRMPARRSPKPAEHSGLLARSKPRFGIQIRPVLMTPRSFVANLPTLHKTTTTKIKAVVQHDPMSVLCYVMLSCRASVSGVLCALLALAVQLVVGATVPSPALANARQHSGTPICHERGFDDADTPAPAPQHDPSDCTVCPLCLSLAAQSPLLISAGVVLSPRSVLIPRAAVLPPAQAPPVTVHLSARPRAPPSLA